MGRGLVRQASVDLPSFSRLEKSQNVIEQESSIEVQDTDNDMEKYNDSKDTQCAGLDVPDIHKQTQNLRRWASDTCLSYDSENHAVNSEMTSSYVTFDGYFRCDVFLRAIGETLDKEPGVKIVDTCLQIVEVIFSSIFIKHLNCARENPQGINAKTSLVKLSQRKGQPDKADVSQLFDIVLKFIRYLGCVRSCCEYPNRGLTAERLRLKARSLFVKISIRYEATLCEYLSDTLKNAPLSDYVKLLHIFLVTCTVKFNSTEVPKLDHDFDWANKGHCGDLDSKIVQTIVKNTFGSFIDKCLCGLDELYNPQFQSLYTEVRQIVQCVQHKHASIFNQHVLAVLIKPTAKLKQWKKQKDSGNAKQNEQLLQTTQNATSKRRGAVVLAQSPLPVRANLAGEQVSKIRSTCNTNRQDGFSVARDSGRVGSVFGMLQIRNWRSKNKQDSSTASDIDDVEETNQDYDKPKQLKHQSDYKRHMEEGGNYKHCTVEGGMTDSEQSSDEDKGSQKHFIVDGDDVSQGLEILRFLINCCPPGTVPEPKLVAAVLDLESPIVCRAAFFLELATFVNKCASFHLPRWMPTINTSAIKSNNRCTRNRIRTALSLQITAGELFHMWGESLAKKLEHLCSLENGATFVLPNVRSDAEKIRLRDTDIREDFLCDNFVNRSGSSCPVPLRMMACQLLYEITAFIRDAVPQCKAWAKKVAYRRDMRPVFHDVDAGDITSQTTCQSPRRKSISFLDDAEKNVQRRSSMASSNPESKIGRKSAPEPALRHDIKGTIFHPTRKASSVSDYLSDNRARSSSTGSALPDVREDSALISVYPVTLNRGVTANMHQRGKGGQRRSDSNFLTVPSTHPAMLQCSSASLSTAGGSISSLGEPFEDDLLTDRGCMTTSNMSVATHSDMRNDDGWMTDTPWLKAMLSISSQQNLICKHKHFCHTYCHQRLVRSCERLTQALCKAIDRDRRPGDGEHESGREVLTKFKYADKAFVSKYLKTTASSLMAAPILILAKSAAYLSDELTLDVQSFCWEMILDENKDIAIASASLFLLCSVRSPHQAFITITSELNHTDANVRLDAILKYRTLWNCRHAVWHVAQEGAAKLMKLLPTVLNYTRPKESIGIEHVPVPDAPWLPVAETLEETISASGEGTENSALLTTETTAHQQEKQMKAAIRKLKEQRAKERRNFHLTDIPIIQRVSTEVQALATALPDDDEAESVAASRRYSHAPSISSSNHSTKDSKFAERPLSRQIGRSTKREQDEDKSQEQGGSREVAAKANAVFPPCLTACTPVLLSNCTATNITKSKFSVGEMALHVVDLCLLEDPTLFLRHLFEKLSGKDENQIETTILLRKLPSQLGILSPHVAHAIFVNILGIMIKAARSSVPGSDRNLMACHGVLTSISPFVEGLEFKTLKMAIRKEQSELGLLSISCFTAPQRLAIYSGDGHYIPVLLAAHDDMKFEDIIADLSVSEDEKDNSYLIDTRLDLIHCPDAYMRDFYFKKTVSELKVVKLDSKHADEQIKRRAILTLMEEIQKLYFTLQLLVSRKNSADKQVNASFLLEEFLRLHIFPRKAIQAPFKQFQGDFGRQIADLDMIHKSKWIELISTVFHYLPTEFPWGDELMLFLNVWNAALVLHPQRKAILRRYGASVIDAAAQLNHQFIKTGYSIVLPTILQIYGEYFDMPSIKDFVEFLCKQLHIIHRHPFILQLIASAAPVLSTSAFPSDHKALTAEKFFTLLLSLGERSLEDKLEILELVKAEQPLRSFDFFYKNDNCSVSIIDCCRLCITVIAACPESGRTLEMIVILEQIIPCYLKLLEEEATKIVPPEVSTELHQLREVNVCICSLLITLECLTRNPSHQPPQHLATAKVQHTEGEKCEGQGTHADAHVERDLEEGKLLEDERLGTITEEFVAPRDVLLQLCATYYISIQNRLTELNISPAQQKFEILDEKSHMRLAEIAQSLLKLLTEDSFSLKCPGLVMYLTEMVPKIDWSDESIRPTLFLILKRLDRLFNKVNNLPELSQRGSRENMNWVALKKITTGLGTLITRQTAVAVIPYVKAIVSMNIAMLIGSVAHVETEWSLKNTATDAIVPPTYEPAVLQLTMDYMSSMRATVTLEDLARNFNRGKRDFVILNLFIPLCINAAASFSGKVSKCYAKDKFPLRESDVMYMFEYAFDILSQDSGSLSNNISNLVLFASPVSPDRRTILSYETSLLLLKVLITCFHANLQCRWFKIVSSIQRVVMQRSKIPQTWDLIDFLLSVNTPLILYLRPFVLRQMPKIKMEPNQVRELEQMKNKALNLNLEEINAAELSLDFKHEVANLKAEITACALGTKQVHVEKNSKEKKSTRLSIQQMRSETGDRNTSSHNQFKLPEELGKIREGSPRADVQEDGISRFRKKVLRRRWTQKSPVSRPLLTKHESKRHSVATAEDTRVREDIPLSLGGGKSFLGSVKFSKNDPQLNFHSRVLSKSPKQTMGSDDYIDNDATSLIDDVFAIVDETRSTFLPESSNQTTNADVYHNFRKKKGAAFAEHSHILIPDTMITEPTPPQQRRSYSVTGSASPDNLKTTPDKRNLSIAL